MHDFIEEALPANSGVNDTALQQLVDRFIAEGIAAQTASEGLASQTSMSLDAFFAASHTSQVLFLATGQNNQLQRASLACPPVQLVPSFLGERIAHTLTWCSNKELGQG